MGGMVLETNMSEITSRIDEQNKIEKQEVSQTNIVSINIGHNFNQFLYSFKYFFINIQIKPIFTEKLRKTLKIDLN